MIPHSGVWRAGFRNSANRLLIFAACVLTSVVTVSNRALAQGPFYPLVVAGSPNVDASFINGNLVVYFHRSLAAAGTTATYTNRLRPGEGAWLDRPVNSQEPTTIVERVTALQAANTLAWLHHSGAFVMFSCRNTNSGYFESSLIEKTYAAPENGTDRPGADYDHVPAISWTACANRCILDDHCAAWSYAHPGLQGPQGQCWLKTSAPNAVPNPNVTSGIRAQLSASKQFPTRDDRLPSYELLSNLDEGQKKGQMLMLARKKVTLPPICPEGLKITEDSEGWEDHLYNDAAKYCTIGYGHLLKRAPCDGTGIEASYVGGLRQLPDGTNLLQDDLYSAHYTVTMEVTTKLTDRQTAAVTDFVFNVGSGNFRKSTLRTVLNNGDFDRVQTELMRWVVAGGKQWPGLVARRQKEIALFYSQMQTMKTLRLDRTKPGVASEQAPLVDIQLGESSAH
jgi:GH24 family phage-related lysozyme (muramidase)